MHTRVNVSIEQVISKIPQLPTSAEILPKIRGALKDPNVTPQSICELIKMDPGLAAQVLRIANSAYYGATHKVKDIESAVNRIGFYKVYELVGMIVSRHVLAEEMPIYHMKAGQLWRISVCCAHMMQNLSTLVKIDTDIAYTIGLMHAAGKVAINHYILHAGIRAHTTSIRGFTPEEELDIFGFTNAQIAQTLLTQWNFREEISIPISCHYNPDFAPDQFVEAASLLYLCSEAAHLAELEPEVLEDEAYEPAHDLLSEVGLARSDIISAAEKGIAVVDKFTTKSKQNITG